MSHWSPLHDSRTPAIPDNVTSSSPLPPLPPSYLPILIEELA